MKSMETKPSPVQVIDLRDDDYKNLVHSFHCKYCIESGAARIDLFCKRKHWQLSRWKNDINKPF